MRKTLFAAVTILLILIAGCSQNVVITTEDKVTQQIENSLSIILSEPSLSSNPHDYIEAHQEEFEFLVKQGDLTLNYFINDFSKSSENGLKEYIMALICIEILGDKNTFEEWASGREWYEHYIKS
ncbi:hypothetical protein H1D32_22750 [Anaerobacillus sp. CMMVII]|uniref:hypothetical protein n=1 Tax=Anaerobacillus sp. CMMVII TaxID=2755588 RepID=UPI0021B713EA|nr:hypothetical protein [Anaerobacillus sp. CMMVII]MCT8140269.1 hypothetical protein [Anaerobacillus sp. CMMVII]